MKKVFPASSPGTDILSQLNSGYKSDSHSHSHSQLNVNDRNSGQNDQHKTAPHSHSNLCSQLLKNSSLKGWEKLFVTTLQKSPNPGRRQLEKLEAIAARLGTGTDELNSSNNLQSR
jgi:hypothetical protein